MSWRIRRLALVGLMALACALALAACGETSDTGGTASWQHYTGAHFSLSYPSDWQEKAIPLQPNGAAASGNTYVFFAPGGGQEVAVAELDGLTSAATQIACTSKGTKVTIAGLPMIYSLSNSGVRNYTFVSASKIGYTLISEGPSKQPGNQDTYNQVMNTFHPDVSDSACS